jgi:hypothetical protein
MSVNGAGAETGLGTAASGAASIARGTVDANSAEVGSMIRLALVSIGTALMDLSAFSIKATSMGIFSMGRDVSIARALSTGASGAGATARGAGATSWIL